ncbi:MAG: inorganic phosphate transporter [Cyclobacteriaceae bacterium]|jgi:PiT family inorganic phosphate transporter|nr:inorganic phosphate transporter [Cyclobacteriaceae bacterium]
MFELDLSYSLLLIVCLIAACGFEFVNGFHDTANAVATVIYTHSLKPWVAVVWSGIWNFIGVFAGGIGVAIGIINLLPVESLVDQNVAHSLAMVLALLISAIFWNLLTWYLGIPCSSSHTLIGSILGVGIAYSLLPGVSEAAVDWSQAKKIGMSLLLSPMIGFSATIIFMFLLRLATRKTSYGDSLFKEPKKNAPPPLWIRSILVLTCTSVSYSHGSNDGQKGVGLIMLILIGIVPSYFALNSAVSPASLREPVANMESLLLSINPAPLSAPDSTLWAQTVALSQKIKNETAVASVNNIAKSERFLIRKDILIIDRNIKSLTAKDELSLSTADRKALRDSIKQVRGLTDYSPFWVVLIIALSLGIGTMIGWKRIVKTIGEKIGKEHLTYAQGASAELVAAATIGAATQFGWPVSTTQVLSSGIAGSMVASKGLKNLQTGTVKNILLAWVLTLPVVMILSGTLFLLFRTLSDL